MSINRKERYNPLAMQVKDLGEFGVIDLLNQMVVRQRSGPDNASPFSFRLLVDTGDDTAAWKTGEATELFTTDTVVEGVHFTRRTIPWRDLGWKSLVSNISDIAAMGGLPLYALVTLGLPPDTEIEDVKDLYNGMLEAGNKYGVAVVGGDMVRSPVAFITVGLTGVHPGQPMLRSAARAGDQVAVTGLLGGSGGGLRLMLEHGQETSGHGQVEYGQEEYGQERSGHGQVSNLPLHVSAEAADYLRRCHRRPEPAVAEGRVLAGAGVAAAMDVSDGLTDDLSKLCLASGLSARLYAGRVPVHPLLKRAFPDDYLHLALNGGEDYVLLFAATSKTVQRVLPLLPEGAVVGELTRGEPGRVVIVDPSGAETVAARGGWDHFR